MLTDIHENLTVFQIFLFVLSIGFIHFSHFIGNLSCNEKSITKFLISISRLFIFDDFLNFFGVFLLIFHFLLFLLIIAICILFCILIARSIFFLLLVLIGVSSIYLFKLGSQVKCELTHCPV